jgi:putative ABC transport system permease protein
MRRSIDGLSALVPVAMAALLVAFCLAGAELYSSSAGSAALDTQFDETCRSDSALTLPVPGDSPRAETLVPEIGRDVPFVQPARRWATARPFLLNGATPPRRLTLLWIDDIDANVSPPLQPLGLGEIALSDGNVAQLETPVGGVVEVDGAQLQVAQQYDDPPFSPVPSFWCGHPELLTPTAGGDRPPPYAIASLATIASFTGLAAVFDEYRVVDEPLTLTDAAALEDGYATATELWTANFANAADGIERNELERVVGRARSVATSVDRNLAPVALTGVVAGTIVLIAAGVLVARDRRRELRLLAMRGLPQWRIAVYAAPRLTAAVAAGGVTGGALAWVAITVVGPSSNLEPSALARSVAWVAMAIVGATVVVAGVVGVVADGFADARRRRVHHRWRVLGMLVPVVLLAAVSFRRLDTKGGIRTFGVESQGGDLLAMGFPLFGLLAVTVLAGLVVGVIVPALRLSGRRLPRRLRLGWRRVVMDTAPLVAVIVSVALAAGCFTAASALAAGSEHQLEDKAAVYVGSDLAVDVFDPVEVPREWEARTTVVSKARVRWRDTRTDLVGIDRARFGSVATLRGDGSSLSLDELIASIAPVDSGMLKAIAVGSQADVGDVIAIEVPGAVDAVSVDVVATATFFPGKTSQVPMLVVDRAALGDVVPFPRSTLLVRDPPQDALETIRSGGVRTGVVLDAADAFEGSAYSALRWAYAPLATLGVLFAVVAMALQLLVVGARRTQRRIADAVMRRTGFTTRGLWWASVVESGVPLLIGSVIGVGAALWAASLAVVRLDPMPALAPSAQFLVPWDVVAATMCVVPLWTAVIALVIVRSTVEADPMRVFQGSA